MAKHTGKLIRALYAGSFDPPSVGHLDIIQRATSSLCHHLIVGVAINPNKNSMFSIEERERLVQKMTHPLQASIEVTSFDGLVVDFAKDNDVTLLVRGIRAYSDLEYELRMALINRRLSGIETAFLMADSKTEHISSSLIRELAHFKKTLPDFVPDTIAADVYPRLGAPIPPMDDSGPTASSTGSDSS